MLWRRQEMKMLLRNGLQREKKEIKFICSYDEIYKISYVCTSVGHIYMCPGGAVGWREHNVNEIVASSKR